MLTLKNIQKIFHQGQTNENHVLKNLNLEVDNGDFITIIGSNGAGKSTLLNVIAGTYQIEEGEILLGDRDITNWPVHKCTDYIGRVFQDPMMGTAASMTIEENLSLALKRGQKRGLRLGINSNLRQEFKDNLSLIGLGLEKRLKEPVHLLSGGQRQALTLLMATMGGPNVLLLDEHTASLDPRTAEKIISLTNKIVEERTLTVLMVTHNMEQALNSGNRTIMMDGGEIILDVSSSQRSELTVQDLISKFEEIREHKLADDRLLLG